MIVPPALLVCMGVSGTGKTTIGQLLADSFDLIFVDADEFHSKSNKKRMAAGIPLSDEDRRPWMDRVTSSLSESRRSNHSCVLAHSALRKEHRDQLRSLGFRTLFLHLQGSRELIAQRVSGRQDHFMNAGLLESQFDALDPTDDEADVVIVEVANDPAYITATTSRAVNDFLETKADK